jgi:hypothetical protein
VDRQSHASSNLRLRSNRPGPDQAWCPRCHIDDEDCLASADRLQPGRASEPLYAQLLRPVVAAVSGVVDERGAFGREQVQPTALCSRELIVQEASERVVQSRVGLGVGWGCRRCMSGRRRVCEANCHERCDCGAREQQCAADRGPLSPGRRLCRASSRPSDQSVSIELVVRSASHRFSRKPIRSAPRRFA